MARKYMHCTYKLQKQASSVLCPYGLVAIFFCTAYGAILLHYDGLKSHQCRLTPSDMTLEYADHVTDSTSAFQSFRRDTVVPCCSTGSEGGALLLRVDQPSEDLRHQDRGLTVLYPRTAGVQPAVGHRRTHLHVLLPRFRWVPTLIQLWCLFWHYSAIYQNKSLVFIDFPR